MPTAAIMSPAPSSPAPDRSSGCRLVAADGRELLLRAVKLRAEAKGGIARVVVEQRRVVVDDQDLRHCASTLDGTHDDDAPRRSTSLHLTKPPTHAGGALRRGGGQGAGKQQCGQGDHWLFHGISLLRIFMPPNKNQKAVSVS